MVAVVRKDVIPIACGQMTNRFFIYRKGQAPALSPTSCVTLAELLKHLSLCSSELISMHNSLCSPRSPGDLSGILEVKGGEPHCAMGAEESILIAAPTRGFSDPVPPVMFEGSGEVPPAPQG